MKRQRGFTLLEVLVALVVLAFLMAGLAQGVQFGVRAWNTEVAAAGRSAELSTTDRILRRLVSAMEPPSDSDEKSMSGTPEAMRFTADLPKGAPTGPLRTAAITLMVDDQHRLILRWVPKPHAALLGPPPGSHDSILMTGVQTLTLSYRRVTGVWTGQWDRNDLPMLIRIHLIFTKPAARHWPDILIAPMRDNISEGDD